MKKNIRIPDPVRFLMDLCPDRKQQIPLLAGLSVLEFLVFLFFCRNTDGGAVVSVTGAVCGLILMFGIRSSLREERVSFSAWFCAFILVSASVGAHLAMLDITPGRYTKVLQPMLEGMWNYDLLPAMAWEENSWSGGYLIVCALLSRLESFSLLYAVKLFDLVCQSLLACAAVHLVRLRGGKPAASLTAMAACMLAPSVLMNIGCWAQCDSVFAMLTLWGLVFLLSSHPAAGCIFWGLALGTKLQSAFLFPLLIPMFMDRKVSIRHIFLLVLAAFALHIPMLLDGQSFTDILSRYSVQLQNVRSASGLSDHAAGVFGLMTVASTREFSGMGLYLGIASALLTACAVLRSRKKPDAEIWLLSAALLAAGLPLVLPQMNARCLFLAGMLAFCCGGRPLRFLAAVLLEIVSLFSCMSGIFGTEVLGIIPLSILAIAAAVMIALELVRLLLEKEDTAAGNAEEIS